jgi:phenylalanyl-tRNA synthetase alpha chain
MSVSSRLPTRPPVRLLSAAELRRDLATPDLTDPASGLHAIQLVMGEAVGALRDAWGVMPRVHRNGPVVTIADNYDVLGFTASDVTRDERYTRYVSPTTVLRTHTSALVPGALRALAAEPPALAPHDALVVCPGVVYRRDCVDRLHTGTPHQLDLWRVRGVGSDRGVRAPRLGRADLEEMVGRIVAAVLPGSRHRLVPAEHPYTTSGAQIDVLVADRYGSTGDTWIEVGECGLAHPELLGRCGLDPGLVSGLALGLGLDRLVMIRKGIDDIRLLRSAEPRVLAQLADLDRYRPVSACPAIIRDLSLAVAADVTAEELGDRVRAVLGAEADKVEEVSVLAETAHADLPVAARQRLGIGAGQKNVLVRVVLRRLDRALVRGEANALRDAVYGALHEGAPVAS